METSNIGSTTDVTSTATNVIKSSEHFKAGVIDFTAGSLGKHIEPSKFRFQALTHINVMKFRRCSFSIC